MVLYQFFRTKPASSPQGIVPPGYLTPAVGWKSTDRLLDPISEREAPQQPDPSKNKKLEEICRLSTEALESNCQKLYLNHMSELLDEFTVDDSGKLVPLTGTFNFFFGPPGKRYQRIDKLQKVCLDTLRGIENEMKANPFHFFCMEYSYHTNTPILFVDLAQKILRVRGVDPTRGLADHTARSVISTFDTLDFGIQLPNRTFTPGERALINQYVGQQIRNYSVRQRLGFCGWRAEKAKPEDYIRLAKAVVNEVQQFISTPEGSHKILSGQL
jgi:hypothetical protein